MEDSKLNVAEEEEEEQEMLSRERERERGGSLVREKKSNKLKETKEK